MKIINCKDTKTTFPIALVVSRFNEDVTTRLYESAIVRLDDLGFLDSQITVVWVPGAIEVPLMVQQLARKQQYSAIVTLGAVIRGETSHYDYVCDQVSQGCQRISIDYHIPVIFGVLTTENDHQAFARAGGSHSNKGAECIDAAVEMVAALEKI